MLHTISSASTTTLKCATRAVYAAVVLGASVLYSQEMPLKIRPPVGDTIYMRMEQKFEMLPDTSSSKKKGGRSKSVSLFSANVSIDHRILSVQWDGDCTYMEFIADKVDITPEEALELPMFASTKARGTDNKVSFKIRPDGSVSMITGNDDSRSSGVVWSHLPAILPSKDVAVGDTWVKDMAVPMGPSQSENGTVKAQFRFDSVSKDARYAYLSMSGTISNNPTASNSPTAGTASPTAPGSMSGSIMIDRKIGWVAESQFTMSITSMVKVGKNDPPKKVTMKVTQTLKTVLPKR